MSLTHGIPELDEPLIVSLMEESTPHKTDIENPVTKIGILRRLVKHFFLIECFEKTYNVGAELNTCKRKTPFIKSLLLQV